MKIIPAINEINFDEVIKKIDLMNGRTDWIQIDIFDGIFVERKTWNDPKKLLELNNKSNINIEIHLMVEFPEDKIGDWLDIDIVKRVVVHKNAIVNKGKFLEIMRGTNKEIGLAIDKSESVSFLDEMEKDDGWKEIISSINFFIIMGVEPGSSGQEFDISILDKIRAIKQKRKDSIVAVDGGINPQTAMACFSAGADIVYSSSYIFNSDDIDKAMSDLLGKK